MKVLVFGHSDSDGSRLANREDAWPRVLERLLNEGGVPHEVVHKLFFAGPGAVAFMERQLEKEEPEVVVVATSTFGVLAKLVSKRVQERFGRRAGQLAVHAEQFVSRHPGPPGSRREAVLTEARRAGRRVVGTSGDFSPAELVACYRDCFRSIAKHEDVHGIVMEGAAYTDAVWRLNPGSEAMQVQLNAKFKAAAADCRFDWFSHEALLGGPGHAKLPYYHEDGVHTDERSQRMVAEVLATLIRARI